MSSSTFRLDRGAVEALINGPSGVSVRALERAAIYVENGAKRLCPVDTGRLRASINHAIFRNGGSYSARVGTNVEYAVFIELGTSRMAAQPFLRPALEAARGRAF